MTPHLTYHALDYFVDMKCYQEFIDEGIDNQLEVFYNQSQLSTVLGGAKFSEKVIKTLDNSYKKATSSDINRIYKCINILSICVLTARYFHVETPSLKISFKKKNYPRMLAIYLSKYLTVLNHQKISEYFTGITRPSLSTILKRCEFLINTNAELKIHHDNLMASIRKQFDVDT